MAIKDVVSNFVESRKQLAVQTLESSSFWVLFFRFILTHWVTILMVSVLSVFGIRSYLKSEELKKVVLEQQLAALGVDLQKMKEDREKLLARVKELDTLKLTAKRENEQVKKDALKMTPDQKKQKILEYKHRLMLEKGLGK